MLAWHPSRRLVDDPGGSAYSHAVDPGALLKLLLYDKTREFAIEETVASLKNSSLAQEKWPDPSYWDLKAKLELEFILEVSPSTRTVVVSSSPTGVVDDPC